MSTTNRMESLWDRIHRYIDKNAPEFAAYLRPGASDEDLCRLREVIGYCSSEFDSLYAFHNGTFNGLPLFDGCRFLSIDEIIVTWTHRKQDLEQSHWNDLLKDDVQDVDTNSDVQDADPNSEVQKESERTSGPAIRRRWWLERWIPFATTQSGDASITIDYDPAESGTYGQIFLWYRDFSPSQWLAKDLWEYLEGFVHDLERDRYDLKRTLRPISLSR